MGIDVEDQRGRVLVIDDEIKLGNLMARALAPEHDVVVLASAEEALAIIGAAEHFDLVLCDLMLPCVSGVDLYERIASIAPDVVGRIVFTTGGAYTLEAVAFLERPNILHMAKPFPSIASFRTAVREHLRRLRRIAADREGGSR